MSHYIRISAIIVALILIHSVVFSFTVVTQGERSLDAASHDRGVSSKGQSYQNIDFSVINIVIDRIEGHTIYAKDGRSFTVSTSTQIMNNHKPEVKIQIGELFFKNGNLIAVRIK